MARLPRPSRPLRLVVTLASAVVALAVAFLPAPPGRPRLDSLQGARAERDVRVLRDEWGVPHVFGKTDADAAFGLAYARMFGPTAVFDPDSQEGSIF